MIGRPSRLTFIPQHQNCRFIAPESRTAYIDALFEALFVLPDKGVERAADVFVSRVLYIYISAFLMVRHSGETTIILYIHLTHRPAQQPHQQVQDRWGLKMPARMTLRTYVSEDGGRAAAMLYLHPGPFMCV